MTGYLGAITRRQQGETATAISPRRIGLYEGQQVAPEFGSAEEREGRVPFATAEIGDVGQPSEMTPEPAPRRQPIPSDPRRDPSRPRTSSANRPESEVSSGPTARGDRPVVESHREPERAEHGRPRSRREPPRPTTDPTIERAVDAPGPEASRAIAAKTPPSAGPEDRREWSESEHEASGAASEVRIERPRLAVRAQQALLRPIHEQRFRSEPAPAGPDVVVTIGRIEVRAVAPHAPTPPDRGGPTRMSLEDYLSQRVRGAR